MYRRFGGADVLEWTDTEKPRPKPGEIRIRVRASSINPFECEMREGAFKMLTGRRFPMTARHHLPSHERIQLPRFREEDGREDFPTDLSEKASRRSSIVKQWR